MDVVELEVAGVVAAGAVAVDAFGFFGGSLFGGGVPAEVDEVDDRGAVLEEEDDEGFADVLADPVDVDGSEAVDVADRPGVGATAAEGLEVDVDEGLGLVAWGALRRSDGAMRASSRAARSSRSTGAPGVVATRAAAWARMRSTTPSAR